MLAQLLAQYQVVQGSSGLSFAADQVFGHAGIASLNKDDRPR